MRRWADAADQLMVTTVRSADERRAASNTTAVATASIGSTGGWASPAIALATAG